MITKLIAGMGGVLSQAPAAAVGYTFKDPLPWVKASGKAGSKATEQQPLDSCLPLLIASTHSGVLVIRQSPWNILSPACTHYMTLTCLNIRNFLPKWDCGFHKQDG